MKEEFIEQNNFDEEKNAFENKKEIGRASCRERV